MNMRLEWANLKKIARLKFQNEFFFVGEKSILGHYYIQILTMKFEFKYKRLAKKV